MSNALIVYEGYALYEWGRGYKSEIGGEWINFDSAGQWKRYIDLLKNGKSKTKGYRVLG